MDHVFSSSELHALGITRPALAKLVAEHRLRRLRIGWYATPSAAPRVVSAVECGGVLSCAGALAEHGLWVLAPNDHARVPPGSTVRHAGGVVHRLNGHASNGVDSVGTALSVASGCLTFDEVIAAVDSALNSGAIAAADLAAELQTPRGRRILAASDARAESGLESLVRLRLGRLGIRVHPQVQLGAARVDLLVGNRLVIECDGDQWHGAPDQADRDRRRDAELLRRGYLVLRLGYRRIVDEWPETEALILELVRADAHRWRRGRPAPISLN